MTTLYEKKLSFGWFRSLDSKPSEVVFHVHQTHSNRVLDVVTANLSEQEADGIVAKTPVEMAIKTADCLPIYLASESGVALLHAGWRGLAGNIISAPEVIAIKPTEAFIGPCIRACCFEVTEEFKQHFPHTPVTKNSEGKLRFDLVAEAYRQLHEHYPWINVTDSGDCTCCNNKYPSFRRDKTTQRIWNLFVPLAQ